MSILTDTTLGKIIDTSNSDKILIEKIRLHPFIEESLTPIGYDLRIGYEYSISSRANKFRLAEGGEFKVKPNETANHFSFYYNYGKTYYAIEQNVVWFCSIKSLNNSKRYYK